MTPDEKRILRQQIVKYSKENCYDSDGSVKCYDLWLVGWVAAELSDRKTAVKALISNEYGLLGNLLYKLAKTPDEAITRLIERTDLEIILKALRIAGDEVLWRNEFDDDPYAMRLLVEHNKKYAARIERALLGSKPFLLSVATRCPELLQKALPSMLRDEDFVFSMVKQNYACMKYLPCKFRSSYELCLEAVRQEGYSLMYLDQEIRQRDDIVLAAVSNRGNALYLATERQKKDRRIVAAAVENCGLALDYADTVWKQDRDLVSLAVSNRGMALRYASAELQDCEEIAQIAVKNDGYAIRFVSQRLQDDPELAKMALATYADAYNYLSIRLRNDPEIKELYEQKKEEERKWLLLKMR